MSMRCIIKPLYLPLLLPAWRKILRHTELLQQAQRSNLTINRTTCISVLLSLLLLPLFASAAELPLLGSATTSSGQQSSAQFRAGARLDDGDYRHEFLAADTLTINAQIAVANTHVDLPGNLFVIIELEGQYFMRNPVGEFLPWDFKPESLIATVQNTPLAATHQIDIVQNAPLGAMGLAGSEFSIFLAYSISAQPEEFMFSSTPLQITIGDYDPLQLGSLETQSITATVLDGNRDREIPLLIFQPTQSTPAPIILFSHGLGGTFETAVYLGEHWSARGYVAVFMQHAGSDAGILEGVAPAQILSVMRAAASAQNLIARVGDVSAVIDQLELWNADSSHFLGQRLDLDNVGMSGHSFGARTTQTTSGEIIPWLSYNTQDPRIKAALPMSASVTDLDTATQLLGGVNIPWMIMTGTLDESVINDTSVAQRLAVFPALPPGGKYELVLFEGEHHAFTDRPVSALQKPRNPAHHPAIMALSTAFWDSFLRGDPAARQWLEGAGALEVLAEKDSWQFK